MEAVALCLISETLFFLIFLVNGLIHGSSWLLRCLLERQWHPNSSWWIECAVSHLFQYFRPVIWGHSIHSTVTSQQFSYIIHQLSQKEIWPSCIFISTLIVCVLVFLGYVDVEASQDPNNYIVHCTKCKPEYSWVLPSGLVTSSAAFCTLMADHFFDIYNNWSRQMSLKTGSALRFLPSKMEFWAGRKNLESRKKNVGIRGRWAFLINWIGTTFVSSI